MAKNRLQRLIQPVEGDADIFGTESSFAPGPGERFDLESADPRGYYIDFRDKTDSPSWPPKWLLPRDRQIHCASIQWGLGAYEHYLHGDGEEWLGAALDCARYLLSIQEEVGAYEGGWLHWVPMLHTYWLDAPWLSSISQGEGVSLFARLYHETGEEEFAAAAARSLEPLRKSTSEGGLIADLGGLPFLEEYPSTPPSHVLNGGIFALWGVRDGAKSLSIEGAQELADACFDALANNLERYDTGRWSRYDLFPHPVVNLATASYHRLHIDQLGVLEQMSDRPEFGRLRHRFAAYRDERAKRLDAFSRKVAFRLTVPRTETLAHRNPSMWRQKRRQAEPSSIALCYHALSDSWPAALSVRPEEFRRQIALLLERGFEPVTFSEFVLGDAGRKRLAITFDDGFASVAEIAAPILESLGVTATLFIPTARAPGSEALSWDGTSQWLDTEHEDELRPVSLEQLRALGMQGWEIGAHSRTHPRLTELGDDALQAEILGSREDCEKLLSQPCLSFAYPYGAEDARVRRVTAESGFAVAAGLPAGPLRGGRYAWPRIGVYNGDNARRFRLKVGSGTRALRRSPIWGLRQRLG